VLDDLFKLLDMPKGSKVTKIIQKPSNARINLIIDDESSDKNKSKKRGKSLKTIKSDDLTNNNDNESYTQEIISVDDATNIKTKKRERDVKYTCDMCNRGFSSRQCLDYHMEKDVCADKKIKCKNCPNKFKTKNAMYRHMRQNCKVVKQRELEKNEMYKELKSLKDENAELRNRIGKLENERTDKDIKKASVKNIKNITNNVSKKNINKGVIVNNNIILTGYGKEDLSKIDKSDILKALSAGYNSTTRLAEAVHFNPKYPEYHNVYITNKKDKYAMMFDGITWNLTGKEDLINRIYEDKKNYIEENLEDFIESLSASKRNALERWLATDEKNEGDEKIKKIKDDIKLLLYNKQNIVINTRKNVENKEIVDDYNDDNVNVIVKKKINSST
jgi:hypothetical protein